jgi:hypothetical protein
MWWHWGWGKCTEKVGGRRPRQVPAGQCVRWLRAGEGEGGGPCCRVGEALGLVPQPGGVSAVSQAAQRGAPLGKYHLITLHVATWETEAHVGAGSL